MFIIFYFKKTNGENLGSANKNKIEHMAGNRPVYFCDISEFNGRLISSQWLEYGSSYAEITYNRGVEY
jgi:hypothetical protein